jgi:succinate dehydrogenase / fumarate reductase iron-sulfur subunit
MGLTVRVWRQRGPGETGRLVPYRVTDITPDMSLLEMLDLLNQQLAERGEEPIAFDSDCREGICGTCGLVINGRPHGPGSGSCTCQLYMRSFRDGDTLTIEPWRARAFPVVRDLVVDRSALDRIMQAGGYISVNTGSAPDANAVLVSQARAAEAFDAAACIGCGACVATCRNASAMLFVAAKVKHLGILPQGEPESERRVNALAEAMQREGFGNCSNEYECEAVCPKGISVRHIAFMNLEFVRSRLRASR